MTNPTIPEDVSEEMVNAAFKALPDEAHGILGAGEMERVLIAALARRLPPADNAVAFERELADGVLNRLGVLTIGTCSCNVMTPELKYHAEACRYRLAAEAYALARPLLTATPSYAEGRAAGLREAAELAREYPRRIVDRGDGSAEVLPPTQGEIARAIEVLIGAKP